MPKPLHKRIIGRLLAPVYTVLEALGIYSRFPKPMDMARFEALYDAPAPAAAEPRKIYHIGHSLVGRDMPAMLAQLAGAGHDYASQLGWGSPLRSHWDPDEPISGFDAENAHDKYRDAHEAVQSGDYDALVLTEMVEIKASVLYYESPQMLHNWARKAQAQGMAVYFYETWHPLDDPEGWRMRLDRDLPLYWEGKIMRPALQMSEASVPIYLIPGGQVMAAFADALMAQGPLGPLGSHTDLFSDQVHFNDYGAYLIALTHYAVLYQKSPVGLPHALLRADGASADDPGPEVARLMQETVWKLVKAQPRTGVRGQT